MPGPQASSPAAVTPAPGPGIKSRKPTGEVAPPLILLDGPEKAGKSLIPVVLSRSTLVGTMYWFDLGEGAADEYASLPDADYEVIEHDGSYREILAQLTAVWHEAYRANKAGEPPVVVVMDSMSREWTMLVDWTQNRANRSNNGQRKLQADPDAEVDPTSNLWNDANKRHGRIMTLLMTFPGIAIVTARGKWVAVMDANGQPTAQKEWKTEGQKNLGYDVTAWISLSREPRAAQLRGVRSLRVGTGVDLPMLDLPINGGKWKVLDLEAFIFDVLQYEPKTAVRDLRALRGDDLEPLLDLVNACQDLDTLRELWEANQKHLDPQARGVLSNVVKTRKAYLETDWSEQPGGTDDDAPGGESDEEKIRKAAGQAAAESANGALAGGSPVGESQA